MDVDLTVDSDAKLIGHDIPPRLPRKAEKEGVSGYVDVTFIVGKTGTPRDITILKEEPTGYGFGAEAIRQVADLQFRPAVLKGERVLQKFKRRYNFESGFKVKVSK